MESGGMVGGEGGVAARAEGEGAMVAGSGKESTEGRVYEVAVPPSAERPLVSSALSTEERRRRFAELGDRSESKIKYVLATSPLSHMFFDDGAESFLAPVQQARIDFLGAPMDENETGLIEFGSSSRLYCVFCDQNKQCPPGKMIKFSLTHLRGHQHKWRKSYYREQLDMCAEFNRRLDLIKSHQIFLKLRPHNGEAIAHKYWCRLCKRGLKGFVEIRDHLRHDYHTQRIAMHAFCEKEGIRVPTRRLGEEVSTKSHFVEVPNVEYLTKDDMDRNGIVITDGVNYPEEPSGWLYCELSCRRPAFQCERLLVGSESSISSSTWSFPSSSTSLSSSFSREELGDTDGHIFGWVPKPRLFEDQHLNGDGMKEGPWAWVEEDDLRRANRRYGNNWSKLIRSSRYRGYAFSGRSYCAIACKWDRMKTRLRMEKLREKRRVQSKPQASSISLDALSLGHSRSGGGYFACLEVRALLAGLVCILVAASV
ncbi:hypothetical protein FOZ62_009837 [Perkinsus olseni]|uniref:C2H2-type domain-containing protein n=1 Tax=Perkinsus olseni TaxID=32597 RepID=A0A7J6S9R9_PEROL|nr:hypothetical protein FOZ62_009837 [Perkinsus olseni]